jgi:hypothetical protein
MTRRSPRAIHHLSNQLTAGGVDVVTPSCSHRDDESRIN